MTKDTPNPDHSITTDQDHGSGIGQTMDVNHNLDFSDKWLSLRDASIAVGRSPHTLKKMAYKGKFGETKKESGRNGEELKLNLKELLTFYGLPRPIEKIDGVVRPHEDHNPDHSITTDQDHGSGIGQTIDSEQNLLIKSLLDHIETLQDVKQSLIDQNEKLTSLLASQQEITRNQQSLSLQQNQLLLGSSKGMDGVVNNSDRPKKKRWWLL
jgi:hypothetical protein